MSVECHVHVKSQSELDIGGRRCRTNVHFLVFHLTLADSITCFITIPMETVWRATIGVRQSWPALNYNSFLYIIFSGTAPT